MEEQIKALLKAHKPTKVCVMLGSDEMRVVNVPNVRNRHERVLDCLGDLEWDRLLLKNKAGETLAVYVVPGAADGDVSSAELTSGQAQVLAMLTKAQESVMRFRSQETTDALNTVVKVMETVVGKVVEAFDVVTSLQSSQLAMFKQMQSLAPAAEDRPVSEDLLRLAAPKLIAKMLGDDKAGELDVADLVGKFQAFMAQQKPAPAPPANGANGAKKS